MLETNDKRRFFRKGCRVPLITRSGSLLNNGQTRDISEGGIGFLSNTFVPLGTNLILEIALTEKSESILAVGKVRWVQKEAYAGRYKVGMEFADISQSARGRLAKYLKTSI